MARSSPSVQEHVSGYPTTICDGAIEDKYLCNRCNNILKNAQQTSCGHRYCHECLLCMISDLNRPICPKCQRGDVDPSSLPNDSFLSLKETFRDAAINREISNLKVHCPHQGCKWKGLLRDFDGHGNMCEFALVQCPTDCHLKVTRRQLPEHLENECPKNRTSCFGCSQSMPLCELPKHKCGKTSPRDPRKPEILKSKNGKEKCHYHQIGCTYQGSKDKVKEHERSSVASHMALLLAAILDDRHSWLTAERTESSVSLKSTHGSSSVTNGDIDMGDDAEARGPFQREARRNTEMEEKVGVIENIISVLNRELVNVHTELGARQEQTVAQVSVIKSLQNKVDVLQRTLVLKEIEINQLDLRLQNLSQETYDGIFLWKITNVALKRQEAISGINTSLYSPVFYLAKYGYKACLRIYLNGDGAGRGTHISLFFTIMKGDYDALLAWPFKHKVTFTLLNQCNGDHLFDAFLPDITSPSFQRPVVDMNIASGCPLFCPLDKLQSPASPYIKDDTMFIRCAIDTSS